MLDGDLSDGRRHDDHVLAGKSFATNRKGGHGAMRSIGARRAAQAGD
jgi:hypothetical protein